MVFPLGDSEKTRIVPIGTLTLIAINVLVYFVQLRLGATFTAAYAATPWEITRRTDITAPVEVAVDPDGSVREPAAKPANVVVIPQAPVPIPIWLTLITAMFLHESPLHLVGNMLYLWIFGDNVEEVLGTIRYVLVYLCCGLVGSLAQIVVSPSSLIPTLGASGAIAGIMGAYLVWFPYHRVRVFVIRRVVEVPALLVIGSWIVIQVANGVLSISHLRDAGGVAYLAHIGGAFAGVTVAYVYRKRARTLGVPTWFDSVRG
jgi:membrane associated rhomboid family serine protease